MKDVIIVGAGPSGVSAALYLKDAGLDILVLYTKSTSLEKAHITNYYGFDKISGIELYNIGLNQLSNKDIDKSEEDVVEIGYLSNGFSVKTKENIYEAKRVILATGKGDSLDKKYHKYLGQGVSLCAICDGPLFRGKDIYYTGNTEYVGFIKEELSHYSDKLHYISEKEIKSLNGNQSLESIELFSGEIIHLNNLFVATKMNPSSLSSQLGIFLDSNNNIKVNESYMTNIKGIYSIGDLTEGIKQVSSAVYKGMVCALSIIKETK